MELIQIILEVIGGTVVICYFLFAHIKLWITIEDVEKLQCEIEELKERTGKEV